MKITFWKRGTVTIYVGGDPVKNTSPDLTIEMQDPQILVDQDKQTIQIVETK